jgi:hypothetical protein
MKDESQISPSHFFSGDKYCLNVLLFAASATAENSKRWLGNGETLGLKESNSRAGRWAFLQCFAFFLERFIVGKGPLGSKRPEVLRSKSEMEPTSIDLLRS